MQFPFSNEWIPSFRCWGGDPAFLQVQSDLNNNISCRSSCLPTQTARCSAAADAARATVAVGRVWKGGSQAAAADATAAMARAARGGAAAKACAIATAAVAKEAAAATARKIGALPTLASSRRLKATQGAAAAALVRSRQEAGTTQRAGSSSGAAAEERGPARVPAAPAGRRRTREAEEETTAVTSLRIIATRLRAAAATVQELHVSFSSHAIKATSPHVSQSSLLGKPSSPSVERLVSPGSRSFVCAAGASFSPPVAPSSSSSAAALSSLFSFFYPSCASPSYSSRPPATAAETSPPFSSGIPAAAAAALSPVATAPVAIKVPPVCPCWRGVRWSRVAAVAAAANMFAVANAEAKAITAAEEVAAVAAGDAAAAAAAHNKRVERGKCARQFTVSRFVEGTRQTASPDAAVSCMQAVASSPLFAESSCFLSLPFFSSSHTAVSRCFCSYSFLSTAGRFVSLPFPASLCFSSLCSSLASFHISSSLRLALLLRRDCCSAAAAAASSPASISASAVAPANRLAAPSSAAARWGKRAATCVSFSTLASLPLSYSSCSCSPTAFRLAATQLKRQGQLLHAFLQLPYVSWRSLLRLTLLLLQHPTRIYLQEPLLIAPVCRRVGIDHFCCVDPLVAAAALLPIHPPVVRAAAAATTGALSPATSELAVAVGAAATENVRQEGRRIAETERAGGDATADATSANASVQVPAEALGAGRRQEEKNYVFATAETDFPAGTSLYSAATSLQQFLVQLGEWRVRRHPYHMHAVQRLLLAVALRREKYSTQQLLVLLHVLTLLQPAAEPPSLLMLQPKQTRLQVQHQDQQERRRSGRNVPAVETLEEREITVQLLLDQLHARLQFLEDENALQVQPATSQQRVRRIEEHEQRQQQMRHAHEQQQQQARQHSQQVRRHAQDAKLKEDEHQQTERAQEEQQHAEAGANGEDSLSSLRHTPSKRTATVTQQQPQPSLFQLGHSLGTLDLAEAYEIVSRAALYAAAAAAAASTTRLPSATSNSSNSSNSKGCAGVGLCDAAAGLSEDRGEKGSGGEEAEQTYPLLSLLSSAGCRTAGGEEATTGQQQQRQMDVEVQLEVLRDSSLRRARYARADDVIPSVAAAPQSALTATESDARAAKGTAAARERTEAAELLTWLGANIRRRITAELTDGQGGGLLLPPASTVSSAATAFKGAAEYKTENGPAAVAARALPSERPHEAQHISHPDGDVRDAQQHQQQQRQQQKSVALALGGASATLARFTFVSALTQLHAVLQQSAAKLPATAAAAAEEGQASLEFAGEKAGEKRFPFNVPKLPPKERAAAQAAVSVLCLYSGVAADAAREQQQRQRSFAGKDKPQQQRGSDAVSEQEEQVEKDKEAERMQQQGGGKLCLPERFGHVPEGRREEVAAALAAARYEEEGRGKRAAETLSAAAGALLRVCALQVPEPFFPLIARTLWIAFHRSSSTSDGRRSGATDTDGNRKSGRGTDGSGSGGGTDRRGSSSNLDTSSSTDDTESSSWSHSSFLKIASSLAPSWWDPAAAAAGAGAVGAAIAAADTAAADAGAVASPSSSSSLQRGPLSANAVLPAAVSSFSSSEEELSLLLHFLPLLCRCAAAAAFRPPRAATTIPPTATRREKTSAASVVRNLTHHEQEQQQQPQQQQEQADQQQQQEQQLGGLRNLASLPLLPTWGVVDVCSSGHQSGGEVERLLLPLDKRRFGKAYFPQQQFIPAVRRLLLLLERSLVLQQEQQQQLSHRAQQWQEQQRRQRQHHGQQEEPQQQRLEQSRIETAGADSCGSGSAADVQAHAEATALVYAAAGAAKRLLFMQRQQLLQQGAQTKQRQQERQRFLAAAAASSTRASTTTQPRTDLQPRQSSGWAAPAAAGRFGRRRDTSCRWRRHVGQKRRCLLLLLQQSEILHATAQLQMQKAVEMAKATLSSLTLKRIIDESVFTNAVAHAIPSAAAGASPASAVAVTSDRTASGPGAAAASASEPRRRTSAYSASSVAAAAASASVDTLLPAGAALHGWLVPYVIAACPLLQAAEYFCILLKAAAAAALHVYIASPSVSAAAAAVPDTAAPSAKEEGRGKGTAGAAPPREPAAAAVRRRRKLESSEGLRKKREQQRLAVLEEQQRAQQKGKILWIALRQLGQHLKQRLHAVGREYKHQCRVSPQQQQLLSTLPQFQQQSRQLLLRETDLDMQRFSLLFNIREPLATLSSSSQVRQLLQWMTQETSRAAAAVQSLCRNVRPELLLRLDAAPRHRLAAEAAAAGEELQEQQQDEKEDLLDEVGKGLTGKRKGKKEEKVTAVSGNSSSTTRERERGKERGEVESQQQQAQEKEKVETKNKEKQKKKEEEEVERLVLRLQQVLQLAEGVARAARYTLYTAITQEPLQSKRWRGPCRGEVEWVQEQGLAVAAAVSQRRKKKEETRQERKKDKEKKERQKQKEEKKEKEKEERVAEEAKEAAEMEGESKNMGSALLRAEMQRQKEQVEEKLQEELLDLVRRMQPKTGAVAWDLCRPPRACRAAPRVYVHRIRQPPATVRDHFKSREEQGSRRLEWKRQQVI